MHMTTTGIVFIPIVLVVFLFRPSRLEELLIYMAVFQGAAVANLGGGFSFGVAPYFFTAALLAAREAIKWAGGGIRFQRREFAQAHLRIFAVFVGWCVVSAFLLPFLFEGTPVDSPRAGAEAVFYSALPLKWSFSNAGQAGYMVLNFFVVLAFTDFCATRPVHRLIRAFTYSGVIVVLTGLYQMLSYRLGLPFPTGFLNSNASWGQNYGQMINAGSAGFHRVSSTFVEPSAAGGFLSGWLLFELVLANWGAAKRTQHWIFAIFGCLVLLATTSSTGYATLGFVMVFMAGRLIFEAVGRGRILLKTAATVGTVVIVGIGFLVVSHGGLSLLDSVLWHKSSSASAVTRMATVWRALAVIQSTCGLGAGLGSNRSFGTLAYVGSNLGLFGLIVFSYMTAHLLGKALEFVRSPGIRSNDRIMLIASIAAFSSSIIGSIIAGAEISYPNLWIIWGLLVSSVRLQHSTTSRLVEAQYAIPTVDKPLNRTVMGF